jgi:LPS export ABC transporter protein LptC
MRRVLPLAAVVLAVAALAACRSGKHAPPVTGSLADSADQIMFGTRFNLTAQGVLRAELVADTALFFDDNTRIELSHPNTTFFTATGARNAVLTARHGTYRTQSGQMVARGDVVVNSQDGRRLTTQELKYDQNRNEVSSDSAFVLTGPDRRLEGIGFRSDPNLQNVRVLNTQSGTTGTLTIPNQ